VCDSCSVFLYDVRLNQLVAKVFNGDVAEGDNRPVSEIHLFVFFVANIVNKDNKRIFSAFIRMLFVRFRHISVSLCCRVVK